jgi:hypothetical protein
MAAFPGVLAFPLGVALVTDLYPGYANVNQTADQPSYPPVPAANWLAQSILSGAHTNNNPIEIHDNEPVGVLCTQFVADYYFRVYVTPSVIALGNLVSAQVRFFDVWNAHFDDKLNSDLNFVGDGTGIVLTEPAATPTTFKALEVRTYELNFDLTGPAAIAITYTWDFPGEFPTLIITGNRVIIFAFAPDWSEDITEKYEWLTQINETEDGIEDRYRLRINPRRSMEYRLLMNETEKRWLERYLWAWKGRVFSVPLWMDCTITTTPTALGAFVIDVDTTANKSFVAGEVAMFVNDYDDTEAVEILNVNATSLDLARATLAAWGSGSRIYPAQSARMSESVSITQPTADIDHGTIRFELVDNKAIPAVEAPLAYEDGFVLERAPNRAQDLDLTWQSKLGIVDFGIVQPLVDERATFPDQITSFTFAEDTRADIWFWKEWLHARAGKWAKFYFSSWSRDFTVVTQIDFNDTAIEVEDTQYRDFYNFDAAKRDIAIYTTDGLVYYRRIASAQEKAPVGSGVEILGINTQLGITYTAAEIKMVSFLHPSRIDSDGVEFEWSGQTIAKLNFNTRVIRE